MSRHVHPDWMPPSLHCHCNGEGRRPNTIPLRVFSSWARDRREQVGATRTANVGTWRCGRCGKVHTVTEAHLGLATSQPCAPDRPA